MIFAAGLGTRFKPWTDHHPKALAMINGKSLLQRNIEYLAGFGINHIVINVHHFADQIIRAVEDHHGWGSEITFSLEQDHLLDTGGGLLQARHLLEQAGRFVTLNVDILTNLDIRKLISFHEKEKALVSFGVTARNSSRVLLFDRSWQLAGWKNNQSGQEKWVNGIRKEQLNELKPMAYSCVTVMENRVFSCITQRGKFSLIDTLLDLAATQVIKGFDHTGDHLVDVGKPESIAIAANVFP